MTADPMAPGRGLAVYQPATAVDGGTWRAPPAVSPRRMRLVCTPIDGMVSATGRLTWADPCRATATTGPVGAGNVGVAPYCVVPGWRVVTTPAGATTATIRPAPSRSQAACPLRGMPASRPRHETDADAARGGEQQPGGA